jgi:hypothetical protein
MTHVQRRCYLPEPMTRSFKILLFSSMSLALAFGFVHLLVPDSEWPFERLHVFLFNLCSAGAIVIGWSVPEGWRRSRWEAAWFATALAYALSAFFERYELTLAISIPLFFIVEWVRVKRFSWFPTVFFSKTAPLREKFHHASLLCLSSGVVIASLVILNEQMLSLVSSPKLTLDVFFLGFSFPISLITMSMMVSYMPRPKRRWEILVDQTIFWAVNLGVIIFFVFIILENVYAELASSLILYTAVFMLFWRFLRHAAPVRQASVLLSGMIFLLWTGLTGVFYIVQYWVPAFTEWKDLVLISHTTVALYGWNLSGLIIITRYEDFPEILGSRWVLALHWLVVFVLATLGRMHLEAAALALPGYMLLLWLVFFSKSSPKEA